MALEGTIKDFGLPDIFQLIGLQRKTGILTLTQRQRERHRHLRERHGGDGRLHSQAARGPAGQRAREAGQARARSGSTRRSRRQKQTLQRLGHILATSSFITSKDLRDALQVQVSQIVFRVFRWRDGHYHFAPTDTVDYDRENFAPMSADFILMEGIRMVDEWPIIEKKIPSMDIVFRPVVDPAMIEVGAAAEEASARAEPSARRPAPTRSASPPEEERIYRKVDGVAHGAGHHRRDRESASSRCAGPSSTS